VDICYSDTSVTVQVSNTHPRPAAGGSPGGAAPNGSGPPDRDGEAPPNGSAVLGRAQPPARLGPGFGLAGIAERVSSCGGTLIVGPADSGGFAVTARLPVR
jgi:hypothetical protein